MTQFDGRITRRNENGDLALAAAIVVEYHEPAGYSSGVVVTMLLASTATVVTSSAGSIGLARWI